MRDKIKTTSENVRFLREPVDHDTRYKEYLADERTKRR
jgi:hypothetical protein